MATEKYQIIARYTDGLPKYWIGRKIDPEKPLEESNVEWKQKDGKPVRYEEYADAVKELKSKTKG